MKLNQAVSIRYGCKFPEKYNIPAIQYYKANSANTRCQFILDNMLDNNNFTLCKDDIHFMTSLSAETWSELLEAFLYASYQDVKQHHRKPKNLLVDLDD